MDTTSNALSRILHVLAQNPTAQDKLRAEITEACGGEDLPYDDLVKLPYLEAVCRETLRLHAPVQFVKRLYVTVRLSDIRARTNRITRALASVGPQRTRCFRS